MACLHRFHNELLPEHLTEVLLIGTFNPIWNVAKGDNPDYFYSRSANQFWCILPHGLGQNCLIDKDRKEKIQFCIQNGIGLSDLIYCIEGVEESDPRHGFLKKGFKDEDFERKNETGHYELEIRFFTEELKRYITKNNGNLKGVFLTRKTSKGAERIWQHWLSIKTLCQTLGITVGELPSPSPRGGGIRSKINIWRTRLQSIERNLHSRR